MFGYCARSGIAVTVTTSLESRCWKALGQSRIQTGGNSEKLRQCAALNRGAANTVVYIGLDWYLKPLC
jgi:hypothetical protein